jgi:NTP pyrophosphatase (non-canonical NTP hydrolase)
VIHWLVEGESVGPFQPLALNPGFHFFVKEFTGYNAKMTKNNKPYVKSPFGEYFRYLDKIDKGKRYTHEFGSIMILGLVEELGEMARAYLAEHGRKKSNLAAMNDETYEQELGDILVSILRFARIKHINLHERIMYSLEKIAKRKTHPKK